MKQLLSIGIIFLLAGCAGTQVISSAPAPLVASSKPIVSDFTATAGNLNCAVQIGLLPATDPAVTCANAALAAFGLPAVSCATGVPVVAAAPTGTSAPSFTATNAGLVSAGSIAYIKLAQAANAKPFTVDPSCETVLGKMQVMGLAAAANPVGAVESIVGLPQIKP